MKVGIVGGGQLGRMLAIAGLPLGMRFRFLEPSADCPAAALGEVITAPSLARSDALQLAVLLSASSMHPVSRAITAAAGQIAKHRAKLRAADIDPQVMRIGD